MKKIGKIGLIILVLGVLMEILLPIFLFDTLMIAIGLVLLWRGR